MSVLDLSPTSRRLLFAAALCALLLFGIATRSHSLGRSLWVDEAWVANSVLTQTLSETFRYPAWLQTSPPLFLLLVRATVTVFGESNEALRAIPSLFGTASLLLFAALAWKLLRGYAALVALLLFVVCPDLIGFVVSLKQYSSDVFASVALLAAGFAALRRRTPARLATLAGAQLVLGFLSYQAILFLPGLVAVVLTDPRRSVAANAVRWEALALVGAGVFVAAVNATIFIAPNQDPSLLEYFAAGFPTGSGPLELAGFYLARLPSLAGPLFFVVKDGAAGLGVTAIALVGVGGLVVRGLRGDRDDLARAALLTAPIAGLVCLNLLGRFPWPPAAGRVLLFLLPVTVLAFALGIELMVESISRPLARTRPGWRPHRVGRVVGALVFLVMAASLARYNPAALLSRTTPEDAAAAVSSLAARVTPDDVVYVHGSMAEPFKLYARATPVAAGRIVEGSIGRPCCPRAAARDRGARPEEFLPAELQRIDAGHARGTLYLLYTDRDFHWRWLGRRDPELFAHVLKGLGCTSLGVQRFRGVRLDRYRCGSPQPDPAATES